MILPFLVGLLALAAAMDRRRGWPRAVTPRRLRIAGWLALLLGTTGCVTGHGWAMGLVRAAALATPAALLALLATTYLPAGPRRGRDRPS